MGYSTTVTMRSPKAKAKMLAFLERHYRAGSDLNPELAGQWRDPTRNMEDNEGLKVGIYKDGGGNQYLQLYSYCSILWIALRAGKRRLYHKRLGIREAVPYWTHDHCEGYPVLIRSEWEGRVDLGSLRDVTIVEDEHGFKPIEVYFSQVDRESWPERLTEDWDKINETIHTELKRLSNLWNQSSE